VNIKERVILGYTEYIRNKVGHDEIIVVGAGIFVYKGRKVLLQRRRDNLCWSMHGGGLEIGETVEEAARRELFEETGLTAKGLKLLGVFSGSDMRYTYPDGDKVCIVEIMYTCEDFSGELLPEAAEVLELKWFDIDDLPIDILLSDKKAFNAFLDFIGADRADNARKE
jgi:8-oxo-dGTP pyrophosphatase MutT (NUDIX family)